MTVITVFSILCGLAVGGYAGWSVARAAYGRGETFLTSCLYGAFLLAIIGGGVGGLLWISLGAVDCASRFPHC